MKVDYRPLEGLMVGPWTDHKSWRTHRLSIDGEIVAWVTDQTDNHMGPWGWSLSTRLGIMHPLSGGYKAPSEYSAKARADAMLRGLGATLHNEPTRCHHCKAYLPYTQSLCEPCIQRSDVRGWIKIGLTCSAGRRSLWARIGRNEPVELCSGREGDDAYVKVCPDNPAYGDLLDVVGRAIYAAGS